VNCRTRTDRNVTEFCQRMGKRGEIGHTSRKKSTTKGRGSERGGSQIYQKGIENPVSKGESSKGNEV